MAPLLKSYIEVAVLAMFEPSSTFYIRQVNKLPYTHAHCLDNNRLLIPVNDRSSSNNEPTPIRHPLD